MASLDTSFNHEVMTDYFFQQHQIATELMLGLTDENHRKIASKWLHYLYDQDSISQESSAKLLIVQGLILMLNANILIPPLDTSPTPDLDITSLSELNFIHLVNQALQNTRPEIPPEVMYEVSEDRREYVAHQKIPGYGAHFCYVYSGEPFLRTETESGVVVLDETIQFEKKVHPLIEKYRREIEKCLPERRKKESFHYQDLSSSFGGMKIPEIDPDDDVIQECELVTTDGEIEGRANKIFSDSNLSEDDGYAKFAQDPVHHDRPRVSLKQTILEKEREQRALLEERLRNRGKVHPAAPKYKRTISTRIKTTIDSPPNVRRELIQAMQDLEEEILRNSQEFVDIPSDIREKFDEVWKSPLLESFKSPPESHVSLPPPPKIDFRDLLDRDDKNQSI